MKKLFFLLIFLFSFSAFAQNDPVAVDDSAQVMNQDTVAIAVLLNDYDPDGDTIVIYNTYSVSHGEAWFNDSTVFYKSEYFIGEEDIRYKIVKKGNLGYAADAYIYIDVQENPNVPVPVADSLHAKFLEPTTLYILENDYDPNGDEFKIHEIFSGNFCDVEISPDSMSVVFTSEYAPYDNAYFYYSIREVNTPESYYSDKVKVFVELDENEELPIAIEDNFEVSGGITTAIDVLENDFNPLNDTLEIFYTGYPSHGSFFIENNLIYYTSDISYAGNEDFEYNIRYKNQPHLYAEEAIVNLNVTKNPDCPIGEADYGSGMTATPISVDVLSNDHDPLGDEIEIMDVKNQWIGGGFNMSFSGDTVTYTPQPIAVGTETAFYRIRKKYDTVYFSEWIPIIYELSQNPVYPVANPDSVITTGGIEVSIPFMKNDIIHDTIVITQTAIYHQDNLGSIKLHGDSLIKYTPYSRSVGRDTIIYSYLSIGAGSPFALLAKGEIYIDINNSFAYDSIDINNINAGFNASGFQFSRIDEILDYGIANYEPHFEVPKGSGKHAMFCNTLWIGGLDGSGQLHLAAERYKTHGFDYQPGPISNSYDSAFLIDWNRMWKISKSDVEYHKNNWWKDEYEPSVSIEEWPGNGDAAYGMAAQLAPYYDNDNNGFYDPIEGDYPYIRGDQCIFFITNDDKIHGETEGERLKVEIHGMAYAYESPDDSILNNTIFVHYDLINRSNEIYTETYFGVFSDLNLGYGWDDRLGCEVTGGSYYVYNGEDIDGDGEPGTYGEYPPALSVSFLAGPFMDPDQEDNPNEGCDFSINGLNFGNGITDDERFGMTRYTHMMGGGGSQSEPNSGDQYYQYLQGLWLDNQAVSFGGAGHPVSGAVGPDCRFMFPGESDPMNWGTDCVFPNEGYNQNGKYWTEEESGFSPFNRSGVGICGPFTFHPGDVQEVDMAYVFANSFHSADSSKNLLIDRLMELRQRVLDGEIIIPNEELDVNENITLTTDIQIYPNPAKSVIYIVSEGLESSALQYDIYTITGVKVKSGILQADSQGEVNIADLENGFYIISVISDDTMISGKIVKQ